MDKDINRVYMRSKVVDHSTVGFVMEGAQTVTQINQAVTDGEAIKQSQHQDATENREQVMSSVICSVLA